MPAAVVTRQLAGRKLMEACWARSPRSASRTQDKAANGDQLLQPCTAGAQSPHEHVLQGHACMQLEQPLQGTHKGRPRFFLGSSRMCRFSTISCTSCAGRASRLLACWEDVAPQHARAVCGVHRVLCLLDRARLSRTEDQMSARTRSNAESQAGEAAPASPCCQGSHARWPHTPPAPRPQLRCGSDGCRRLCTEGRGGAPGGTAACTWDLRLRRQKLG